MDHRAVLAFALALAALVACSGPDPGSITFVERTRSDVPPSSSGGPALDGGDPGTSSGGTDGGSSGAPSDPVFGTTAFVAGTAPQNANGANAAHAGTVEGKNCVQAGCHAAGGTAPVWAFGGTVYATAAGGATVANAEVRVSDPAGTQFGQAYTDANGNFWFEKGAADIPANSRVGVRDATRSKIMSGTVAGVTGADCNAGGCHGNAAMRIFLN